MTEVLQTLHSRLGLRQHNKNKSFSLQFVAKYEQIATPVWMICTYAAPSMQSPTPPQLNMSASTFPSFLEQPITSPLASRSHSTLSHHIPAQISNEVQRMFKRRFLALRPPTNSLHAHLRRRAPWPQMPAMLVIPTCHLYFQVTSTPWESWGKALLHGSKSNLNRHIFVTDHFTKMFSCTSPG